MPIIILMYPSNFHSSNKYLLNAYYMPGSIIHQQSHNAVMLLEHASEVSAINLLLLLKNTHITETSNS